VSRRKSSITGRRGMKRCSTLRVSARSCSFRMPYPRHQGGCLLWCNRSWTILPWRERSRDRYPGRARAGSRPTTWLDGLPRARKRVRSARSRPRLSPPCLPRIAMRPVRSITSVRASGLVCGAITRFPPPRLERISSGRATCCSRGTGWRTFLTRSWSIPMNVPLLTNCSARISCISVCRRCSA
jgi:hypothetical protein